MDKCVLGQDVYLVDDDIGKLRPNDNEIINGATGTGKTMSIFLPTILNTKNKSLIVSLNKRAEAWKLVKYKSSKGYRTYVCDLVNPDDSTVSFWLILHRRVKKSIIGIMRGSPYYIH